MKTVGCSFMFFTAALKLLNLRQGSIVTLQILFKNQIFLMKVMPKLKQKNKKHSQFEDDVFLFRFYTWAVDKFSNPPTFQNMTRWPNTHFFVFFKFLHEYILFSTPLFVCLYVCIYTNPFTHSREGSALTY